MKNHKEQTSIYPFLLEIGFRISIPLVLFVILGAWVDKALNTTPIFVFLGIFLSLFSSTYGIYRVYKKLIAKKEN